MSNFLRSWHHVDLPGGVGVRNFRGAEFNMGRATVIVHLNSPGRDEWRKALARLKLHCSLSPVDIISRNDAKEYKKTPHDKRPALDVAFSVFGEVSALESLMQLRCVSDVQFAEWTVPYPFKKSELGRKDSPSQTAEKPKARPDWTTADNDALTETVIADIIAPTGNPYSSIGKPDFEPTQYPAQPLHVRDEDRESDEKMEKRVALRNALTQAQQEAKERKRAARLNRRR